MKFFSHNHQSMQNRFNQKQQARKPHSSAHSDFAACHDSSCKESQKILRIGVAKNFLVNTQILSRLQRNANKTKQNNSA